MSFFYTNEVIKNSRGYLLIRTTADLFNIHIIYLKHKPGMEDYFNDAPTETIPTYDSTQQQQPDHD